ncbi:MinD/ParA family ATP-binding protein [Paenibacillus lactis]|uniref:MinD/ParA family ATP-binding protein n=1 Tax=Paenibacillus lactis TaxID=228574 RepID=UPI00369A9EA6
MGFTVVFWSPVSGQAGTTSNLIAAAALLGLEYSSRLLLLGHLQSEYAAIERGFYPRRSWTSKADVSSDVGSDALLRLLQNRKLEPKLLRNYTLPLLAERLDILPGSNKPDVSFVSSAQDWFGSLLELTRRAYDLVLLDGGSGDVSEWTRGLLRLADLLVVCLPQNILKLEQAFPLLEAQLLSNRKLLLVFGQVDPRSSLTIKNIMRQFYRREPAYPIVHNTGWLDAVQHGDAIHFLFRNRKVPRDHENNLFVQQVRALAQAISQRARLGNPLFGGKEDDSQ